MTYLTSFGAFENLNFEFVSDLEISISDFGGSSRRSTFVESPLQIHPFYAKQTQFAGCPNERKFCYNNEL
jgi:hypothetical protein